MASFQNRKTGFPITIYGGVDTLNICYTSAITWPSFWSYCTIIMEIIFVSGVIVPAACNHALILLVDFSDGVAHCVYADYGKTMA